MTITLDTEIEYEGIDYYIEVEVDYWSEIYGDDADGNRGELRSYWEVRDCRIEIYNEGDCIDVTDKMYDKLEQEIHEFINDADIDF